MDKDYSPFNIAEKQPSRLKLQLKTGYSVWWFVGMRIAPLFMFLFLGIASFGLYKDLPKGVFVGMYLFFIIGIMYLWFQQYVCEITFEKGRITRKISTFFSHKRQTETLTENDTIISVKEHKGRSAFWSFYLVQNKKKKRLFYIPIFFNNKIKIRDNFVEAIEEICELKVVIKKDNSELFIEKTVK